MTMPNHRFDVNLSMLFTELPLLQRPAAAKAGRVRRGRVLVAVRHGGAGRRRGRRTSSAPSPTPGCSWSG